MAYGRTNARKSPEVTAARLLQNWVLDRKPLEPPPVIEILLDDNDPYKNFLSSPYYFMCATLHDTNKAETSPHSRNADLAGTLVSSLHRVKDTENNDVGYFVFQDLSVRKEGDFRLKFSLFELQRGGDGMTASYIKSTLSKPFKVYSSAKCPPPLPSTFLTKHLQEQGIKLRTKKTQNSHGRRARRPEEWSSELPQQANNAPVLNRLPIPRSMTDSYQNRFPSTHGQNHFRRDSGGGYQVPLDTNFAYGEGSYAQTSYGSDSLPYRHFDRRQDPAPKRHKRNPSFPDIDTRYVLGSHKSTSHGNEEEPTTPHSASTSFNDNYFSQYVTQGRSNDSPSSRTLMSQPRRQYSSAESNHYPTPDSSRSYQGHAANRLSVGSELAMGYGGSTEPGRHHYPSSAETQGSIPAPAAMHPPVQGPSRPSPTSDSRYWQGSFENSTSYGAYHSRNPSINALPTGHLLPAPTSLQSRSSMENSLHHF
ncbi:hypothetical protein EPUS_03739 [Endocarpon pusillum Z07020]|uniref:Velvet domain-containing protein n=1 Tax=Endocarpon pusillum (strain Z07020 / HMAS-L-300199) TaxID=1263415 RepID=U1G9Q3_ENDPU|nr:uncharacterized protein EPUS_03739 [Endocarpon pusillum Z07020]ERF68421.1 hypothetical protein EPUS_03739 [Endocarpon pusillum Z07020]